MPKAPKNTLPAKVKFKPPTPTMLLKQRKRLQVAVGDRNLVKMLVSGHSYEDIAEHYGLTHQEAYQMSISTVDRWCKEFGVELIHARELDGRRLDTLLVILTREIEPKPMLDADLNPVYDNGQLQYEPVDKAAMKLYLEVLERRAKLYGLDAARKVEVKSEVDVVERRYIGVRIEGL